MCDDQWDITDGNVLCKSIGFLRAKEATVSSMWVANASYWHFCVHLCLIIKQNLLINPCRIFQ